MSDIGYSLSVDIKGLEEQMAKIGNFGPLLNKHLEKGMQETTIYVASKIIPLVPVGVSSRLKNSIGSEIRTEGIGSIVGVVGSSLKDEEYPKVMEFGRKPGTMPPPDALIRWVHLKGLAGRGRGKNQAANERNVAFAVARGIKMHGIKGRFYMKQGLEKGKPKIPHIFKKHMDELMEELVTHGG